MLKKSVGFGVNWTLIETECVYALIVPRLACADEFLDDIHSFDGVVLNWTDISVNVSPGVIPKSRYYHGMASVAGQVFVYGGWSKSGAYIYASVYAKAEASRDSIVYFF